MQGQFAKLSLYECITQAQFFYHYSVIMLQSQLLVRMDRQMAATNNSEMYTSYTVLQSELLLKEIL